MAVKARGQIGLTDITDAYSVSLTTDSFTFQGDTTKVKTTQSFTTKVEAKRGATVVSAVVTVVTDLTGTGLTVTDDGDSTSPTLTVQATTTLTDAILRGSTLNGQILLSILVDGKATFLKAINLSIALTGASGSSSQWYTGNKITGTSTTATTFSGSGISSAKVGDMYLNTDTMNTYRCTVAGAASAAKWVYVGNIKGQTGATGPGAVWYTGTKITGTSTTATVFSGSGITDAKVGDMYLNTSTDNTYRCTVAGAASVAKWVYVNNIKGQKGDTGDEGEDAITIVIIPSGGTVFKNSAGSKTLTAHVFKGNTELTGSDVTALGSVYWYKGAESTTKLNQSHSMTLTVQASDVTDSETYEARLEA